MVAPTRLERLRAQRRQDKLLRQVEKPFTRANLVEKNRFVRKSAKAFMRFGTFEDPELFAEHKNNMTSVMRRFTSRAIRLIGFDTAEALDDLGQRWLDQQMEHKADPEDFQSVFSRSEIAWMEQFGAAKALSVSQTTRNDLRRVLEAARREELTDRETEKRLLQVRGINRFRAATIARTEAHNAAIFGSEQTAKSIQQDTGVQLLKFWAPALDERTRANHALMFNSEGQPLDGFFTVGGEKLVRPGDPNGSAGNIINCRCILEHRQAT